MIKRYINNKKKNIKVINYNSFLANVMYTHHVRDFKANATDREHEQILENLKFDSSIIITKPDKGKG